jgi:glyceraldehyde 3-phosphate dehydrogenase
MAKLKVGINGMGRIGRVLFRAALTHSADIEVVGINNLDSLDGLAHLLKYDSTHGTLDAEVSHDEKNLIINGKKIPVSAVKAPGEIPWKAMGADLVWECTGAFKKKEDFMAHIDKAGAKSVMVSAPADGVDGTFVFGVNHEQFNSAQHKIISNASCTTNCLAPLAKVLHENFGIVQGTMTTIHSYTNDQRVLDAVHKDLRRARTAATNMIPTSTGAAKAVGLVLPELKGKIDGISVRVPTPNVSLVDFTFNSVKDMSIESINAAFTKAALGPLNGVLGVENHELVSTDFNGNVLSSIVDLPCTMTIGPRMAKVLSWYDNETGFSNRMIDLSLYMNKKGM